VSTKKAHNKLDDTTYKNRTRGSFTLGDLVWAL